MTPDEDTLSVSEWQSDSSLVKSSQRNRRQMLDFLAKANGKATVEEVFDAILRGELKVYSAARAMIDYLRKTPVTTKSGKTRPRTVSSIGLYRSMLPDLFLTVLGASNFNRETFDRLVKIEKGYNKARTTKYAPKREEVKQMLRMSDNRDRSLIGGLACSGARIGEWVTRKMSEIVRRNRYGVIYLGVDETKALEKRRLFITEEVLGWIDQYHKTVNSDWIFPGEDGKSHLALNTARFIVELRGKEIGIDPPKGEVFSPHSFRTFVDRELSRCGLDRKYVELIVSHANALAASGSYKDWDDIEAQWYTKCEPSFPERDDRGKTVGEHGFTWLKEESGYTDIVRSDIEQSQRLTTLEQGFSELVKAVLEGSPDKKKIAERLRAKYALEDKTEPAATFKSGN